MAAKTLQANFKRMLARERNKIKNLAGVDSNVIFDLTIGGRKFISGLQTGMEKGGILKALNLGPAANEYKVWATATTGAVAFMKEGYKPWRRGQYNPGIYILGEPTKSSVTFRILRKETSPGRGSVPQDTVDNLAKRFRAEVYERWRFEVNKQLAMPGGQLGFFDDQVEQGFDANIPYESKQRGLVDKSIKQIITQNTEISHQTKTTKADMALRKLADFNPSLSAEMGVRVQDILAFIDDNVEVDLKKTAKKLKVGKYDFATTVKARLEYNVKGSAGSDTKDWTDRIETAINDFIEGEVKKGSSSKYHNVFGADPDGKASKTPRQVVSEDAVVDILLPLTKSGKPDMRFNINKMKFKPQDRDIPIVKSKKKRAVIDTAVAVNLAGTSASGKRPEKGKREDTRDAIKIQKQIQSRLPAEVRRNMGKPALTNRTGRFSNSVDLVSLRKTPAGLSGEYTYRLDPYQTFENEGPKKWPSGYNPKTLIAKSIRNLALQYTEEKLVSLRRV